MQKLVILALAILLQACTTAHAQITAPSKSVTLTACEGQYITGPCVPAVDPIIFRDNFDAQADWAPPSAVSGCTPVACDQSPPANWSYWRNDEWWFDGGSQPTGQITSAFGYRGGSGKALVIHNESNEGSGYDGWGADFQLAKNIGDTYTDVWVTFYFKVETPWQWDGTKGSSFKLTRVQHFWGNTSPFSYFTGGDNSPIAVFDFGKNPTYGVRQIITPRCSPHATSYTCPSGSGEASDPIPGTPTWEDYVGDGAWHKLEWHAVLNSSEDVADGTIQLYIDGTLSWERTDQIFIRAGSGGTAGIHWNIVTIGGNAYNRYDTNDANKSEQYYLIDDFTISSVRCTDCD